MPPATPESLTGIDQIEPMQLPSRDACLQYVTIFFDEVHCLYWLYSSEAFHTRLEATYSDLGASATASWRCALYSIFALGSQKLSAAIDRRSSADYLSLAKSSVSKVCDEADLDSVRALVLLVSHLHNKAQRQIYSGYCTNYARHWLSNHTASATHHISMQERLSELPSLLAYTSTSMPLHTV